MNHQPDLERDEQLTSRLRQAVHAEPVPPFLEARVRAHLAADGRRPLRWWTKWSAAGAALAVIAAAGISYELGHLRFTEASQESYVVKVTHQVATIMRAGLGDHVHCAYFRKFPTQPPPVAEFVRHLGPKYAGLLPIVSEHAPSGTRVEEAHVCLHAGRKFVHLTLRGNGNLLSLVVARKKPGESFAVEGLAPVLVQSGLPVYRASAQQFEIAAFETKSHLVYFVSGLPGNTNQESLLAMTPAIRGFLNNLEQL